MGASVPGGSVDEVSRDLHRTTFDAHRAEPGLRAQKGVEGSEEVAEIFCRCPGLLSDLAEGIEDFGARCAALQVDVVVAAVELEGEGPQVEAPPPPGTGFRRLAIRPVTWAHGCEGSGLHEVFRPWRR